MFLYDVYNYYTHTNPEVENVSFSVPLVSSLDNPEDIVLSDIKGVISSHTGWQKTLDEFDKWMTIGQKICSLYNIFHYIENTFLGVDMLLCSLSLIQITEPVIAPFRDSVAGILAWFQGMTNTVFKGPWFTIPCALVLCKGTWRPFPGKVGDFFVIPGGFVTMLRSYLENLLKNTGDIGELISKVLFFGTKVSYYDSKSILNSNDLETAQKDLDGKEIPSEYELSKMSLIIASVGLCLPAIAYHLRMDTQLNCFKAKCYLDVVLEGGPKTECDKQYEFASCLYKDYSIWSIMIEFLGFDRILKAIYDVIKNPLVAAYVVLKIALSLACGTSQLDSFTCLEGLSGWCIPHAALTGIEATVSSFTSEGSFSQLWNAVKNMNGDGSLPNFCKDLEEDYNKKMQDD